MTDTIILQTLPLVVQDKFHWSSLGSGLIFIPLSLPTFLSPVMGESAYYPQQSNHTNKFQV